MIFYHGSKRIIKEPIVKGSNPKNDYGPSFYMTLDLDAVKSWSCRNDSLGVINKYSIEKKEFDSLKVLDLTDKNKYSVLNWIAILMHFRELDSTFKRNYKNTLDWLEKYYINVDDFDVVIGYRADDAYFKFPIRLLTNALAIEDLEYAFMLGNLGIQYAFMSNRALKLLKYVETFECEKEYLGHYYSKIVEASQKFDELLSAPADVNKTYIIDLMRKDNE